MSFDFGNLNPINKAQAAYKDGGGMGGGGMYMQQGKKRKKGDEDMFEYRDDKDSDSIDFESNSEIKEEDIPQNTLINKFVNWFRIGRQ